MKIDIIEFFSNVFTLIHNFSINIDGISIFILTFFITFILLSIGYLKKCYKKAIIKNAKGCIKDAIVNLVSEIYLDEKYLGYVMFEQNDKMFIPTYVLLYLNKYYKLHSSEDLINIKGDYNAYTILRKDTYSSTLLNIYEKALKELKNEGLVLNYQDRNNAMNSMKKHKVIFKNNDRYYQLSSPFHKIFYGIMPKVVAFIIEGSTNKID